MKEKISRNKIRCHYKSFFGLENMGLAKNDNLMIDWGESLINELCNQEVERRKKERMPTEPKRLFQVLDELNLDDTKNGTRLVSISNSFISADKVKAGTKVAMGADDQVLTDIMTNRCALLLVVVDRKEYELRSRLSQKTEGGGE